MISMKNWSVSLLSISLKLNILYVQFNWLGIVSTDSLDWLEQEM